MRLVLVVVLIALQPSNGLADELSPEAKSKAKTHYLAGERAFNLGDFQRAVTEWRESYDASGEAVLLFDIGQAYRQLGDYKQALFLYRQFLTASSADEKAARQRKIAQEKITELEPLLAAQQKAQQSPPTGTAPSPQTESAPRKMTGSDGPPHRGDNGVDGASRASNAEAATTPSVLQRRRPAYQNPIGWALVGGGVATLAVGAGLTAHGADLAGQVNSAPSLVAQMDLRSSSDTSRSAGIALLAIGGVAAAAGVVVFIVDAHRHSGRYSQAVRVSALGALLISE